MNATVEAYESLSESSRNGGRWWCEWEIWLLAALVLVVFFSRMGALPVRGEESRRARVACEMLESGDWIVPRQQGTVYLSRPPLGSWLMALVGRAQGTVDVIAIRAPSALAILLTTLLIYAYGRTFLTRAGALACAAAFPTMGQVLELGQTGETEAVFTLLVSSSLLIWHGGYQASWPRTATWVAGYALAALAGLDKGPQGPIYFLAPVFVYLAWRRDWRSLFSWPHAAGIIVFLTVLGAWQVPFYLATGGEAVQDIWLQNAAERFAGHRFGTLLKHVGMYPLELFACMLPWSALLLAFLSAAFRRVTVRFQPNVQFLVIALVVTFPSVWFAPAARGRYFMPLYPCFAILIGMVVDACLSTRPDLPPQNAWRRFLTAIAASAGVVGVGFLIVNRWGIRGVSLGKPVWFTVVYLLGTLAAGALMVYASRQSSSAAARMGILAVACFVGLSDLTLVIDGRKAMSEDSVFPVARLRSQLPPGTRLVSLGLIDHLFAFLWADPIRAEDWPAEGQDLPPDVEYFCFNQNLAQTRKLSFAWESVAVLPLDRHHRLAPERAVIVGRRLRDSAAEGSASRSSITAEVDREGSSPDATHEPAKRR